MSADARFIHDICKRIIDVIFIEQTTADARMQIGGSNIEREADKVVFAACQTTSTVSTAFGGFDILVSHGEIFRRHICIFLKIILSDATVKKKESRLQCMD